MKKCIKIIIPIVLLPIILYVLFITAESIRLSVNKRGTPLIVLEKNNTYEVVEYKSLGFSLVYKLYHKSDGLVLTNGQEFWLFDKFLIWGWIS